MEILSLQGFEFFGGLRFFCGFTGGEGNGGGGRMWSWGQWWHQGEGGESVMGRGEKRNIRVRREEAKNVLLSLLYVVELEMKIREEEERRRRGGR